MVNMPDKGIFTISIDLELAWGICDKQITKSIRDTLGLERQIIRRILELFAQYDIRVTWAIVGHLLLSKCDWKTGLVHPEIIRPNSNNKRDWFFQHPKEPNDPLWYGRDIIEWIKTATPKQEIGSHSFCHILYHETMTNRDTVKSDIKMAKKLHEASGLPFETFVFPRNIVSCKELLAEAGIRVYRGESRRWYNSVPSHSLQRLLNFIHILFAVSPVTVRALVDETGMVNIPDSMLLIGRNGLRGLVSSRNLIKMGQAGLNRAVKKREIFHLWLHPFNFVYKTGQQFYVLESILRQAQCLRLNGQLEILSMRDIMERVEGTNKLNRQRVNLERIRNQTIAQHDKTADYFESEYRNMAKDYYASIFAYGRQKIQEVLEQTLNSLPKGASILDIGCGTGEHIRQCRRFGFKVRGIEPSQNMRTIASKNNPGSQIMDGIITNLPFQNESFDFILAIEVLRYLHPLDIQLAYRQMMRVLRPGGLMFFTMVNRYAWDGFYIYEKIKKVFFRFLNRAQPVHCEFVTPLKIRQNLNNLGVKEIEFYGRLFAPLRIIYRVNSRLGRKSAKFIDNFFDNFPEKEWMLPFAGHLIVVAKRPYADKIQKY